ncbi:VTT domain-containing protein [Frigoribacterium sp. UYMn621]|jgi:membrane-associated protein|uniref:DedA family protein n=1 Tax=Frigoribacterium sp. UYMn621 TaxID=3156343 RepID=UPI00339503A7
MNPVEVLVALAGSPWAYVLLAALLLIDGFFPFVPGETAVVTLASLSAAGHGPPVWSILALAIVASTAGDAVAFANGSRLGTRQWAWMRRPRIVAMFEWAERGLVRKPALFLVSAKFVPVARVAVTMTAGSSRLPFVRYLPIALLASTVYTTYHVGVALFAGSMLGGNPLMAVGVAIATVSVVAAVIECAPRVARKLVKDRTDPPMTGP